MTALLGGNTINGGLVRLSTNLILIGRRGGILRLGPEDFLGIRVKVLRLVGNSGRMWRLGAKGCRIYLVHWNGGSRWRGGEMDCIAERPRGWGRCGCKRHTDQRDQWR